MVTGLPDLSLLRNDMSAKALPENGLDVSPETAPLETYRFERKLDVVNAILRLLCMASSVTALLFMVTARESSALILYGFRIPVQSKWSYSSSFLYLVGVSAAVAAHSLIQLLLSIPTMLRKSSSSSSSSSVPPNPRNLVWLLFAADQVLAYTLTSAGSAASGVTHLNRAGMSHTPLPNFCNPLQGFCDHITVSIAFTFIGCVSLAASAVVDAIRLSQKY